MHAADAFAALALALPAEAPPPALRARILDDAKPPRLAAMIDKLASLFDIDAPARAALLDAHRRARRRGSTDRCRRSSVMFVDGAGPRLDGALCAFVKMGAGVDWPAHSHLGTRVHARPRRRLPATTMASRSIAGDLHVMEEGTAHGFTIFDDEPCIAPPSSAAASSFEDPACSSATFGRT